MVRNLSVPNFTFYFQACIISYNMTHYETYGARDSYQYVNYPNGQIFAGPLDWRMFDDKHMPELVPGLTTKTACKLPTIFVSGRVSDGHWTWRRQQMQTINSYGYIGLQNYAENQACSDLGVSMKEVAGKSFVYLMVSDGMVISSQAGVYSLAEFAFAKFIDLPIIPRAVEGPIAVPRKPITQEVGDQVKADKATVWDHIMEYTDEVEEHVRINFNRVCGDAPRNDLQELQQHTFWEYSEAFLKSNSSLLSIEQNFLRSRVGHLFQNPNYRIMQGFQPPHERKGFAVIDGKRRDFEIVSWENDWRDSLCLTGWFRDEKGRLFMCRRIPGTEEFTQVKGAKWEDWQKSFYDPTRPAMEYPWEEMKKVLASDPNSKEYASTK